MIYFYVLRCTMKKLILMSIILVFAANQAAFPGVMTKAERKLPQYMDAQKRNSAGLSIPLRWAPELKAWEDERAGLYLRGPSSPYTSLRERAFFGLAAPFVGGTPTQEPAAGLLYFTDKYGITYSLSLETYDHIAQDYNIGSPSAFIREILTDPLKVVADSTNPDRQIYYKKYPKPGKYRGVVVGTVDREIKTVHITDTKPQ
jgi:hypothetical protein